MTGNKDLCKIDLNHNVTIGKRAVYNFSYSSTKVWLDDLEKLTQNMPKIICFPPDSLQSWTNGPFAFFYFTWLD